MSPRYINEILRPLMIVFGIIFLIMILYGFFANEEYQDDDDDTITVTFNCTQVLSDQTHYQDFIVNECRDLKKHGN